MCKSQQHCCYSDNVAFLIASRCLTLRLSRLALISCIHFWLSALLMRYCVSAVITKFKSRNEILLSTALLTTGRRISQISFDNISASGVNDSQPSSLKSRIFLLSISVIVIFGMLYRWSGVKRIWFPCIKIC